MENLKKAKKVAFLTLGCKTNQYETNGMMQKFREAGYEICELEDKPDVYVVNTCTVTNISDRKSRQAIRKVKQQNGNVVVVAVGCYAQVGKADLEKMEEINIILGNKEKKDIVKYVEKYVENKDLFNNRDKLEFSEDTNHLNVKDKLVDVADISVQNDFDEYGCVTFTDKSRTTIKIQDGCNQFCTYCLIPYARGRIRSRKKEKILEEARNIAKNGIKEIVLTGIHIASYGKDFEEEYMLIDLLEDLNKIDGIKRIRLGSLEPTIITNEFVNRLKKLDKVCKHFHLSLQSGCDSTLKRMNRKYTTNKFKEVVELLRANFEDVNLTTDIIVGFPGETEEEFMKTYKFLKDIAFYKMHVFKYSKRNGTLAALMPNQVDGNIKEKRGRLLIELSDKYQYIYNCGYIGKELEVLLEEKISEEVQISDDVNNNKKIQLSDNNKNKEEYWIGHTDNYVVVKVISNSKENLENEIIDIICERAEKENLIGRLKT